MPKDGEGFAFRYLFRNGFVLSRARPFQGGFLFGLDGSDTYPNIPQHCNAFTTNSIRLSVAFERPLCHVL
jgi:hypothetical protein